jgi:diguanylate cyclase (GGDEF)-like protein
MLRRLIFPKEVTDQEARRLARPAALAIMALCGLLILSGWEIMRTNGNQGSAPILIGIFGVIYGLILLYVIVPSPKLLIWFKWPIALINALAINIGVLYLPAMLGIIPHIILVLIAAIMIIIWGRAAANIFLLAAFVLHIGVTNWSVTPFTANVGDFSFFLMAGIVIETIQRLGNTNTNRIKRLEAINEFARQVSSSLDTDQVLTLISAAIQKAIEADSYYFGLVEGDQLQLHLIFDEGEFFPPAKVHLGGTLSNWVIQNQSSLFIPDLRNDVYLEGVKLVLIGKDKTSLCWMGVPMRAGHVNGIIAIGSYTPNVFNRADLELLENLAQQAALALDNTFHHAEVEAQSRLDSLTGAYNHGYIVNILNYEAENGLLNSTPLSLIMLDIDHFKQYNDNFGHIVGDQVLTTLTQAIRQHIKSSDSLGRWGGEEFAIVLPGTNGPQTQLIAERVRETINALSIHDREEHLLPFPTVSQGLAVFPDEANAVNKLIDLADQRLYIAKERGRNQIEPKSDHWKHIK